MRWLKPFLFWAVVLGIQGTLMGLSHWQWHRLSWKENAIALRDARWASEAIPIEQALSQSRMTPDWLNVRVCGQVIPQTYAKVSYVAGLPKSAFSVVVPMTADLGSLGNRNVLLDIGYVYFDEEMKSLPHKTLEQTSEKQCVSGHILPVSHAWGGGMGGKGQGDVYSYFDIDTMAHRWGMESFMPWVVRLDQPEALVGGAVKAYPNTPPALRNSHLGYALTWMALAVIWPVMVWLRLKKTDKYGGKPQKQAKHP
jgi:surfeit locus 1 family protein